jgi:hypothetical protein
MGSSLFSRCLHSLLPIQQRPLFKAQNRSAGVNGTSIVVLRPIPHLTSKTRLLEGEIMCRITESKHRGRDCASARHSMTSGRQAVLTTLILFACLAVSAAPQTAVYKEGAKGETVGTGDGRIHVIPTLSSPSCKNGENLTISAVIKAPAGVREVIADIPGVAKVRLQPVHSYMGPMNLKAPVGMWRAEWEARGLEEKIYPVTLRVTDATGHVFEDKSLRFSDPAAGITNPGTTDYPGGGMSRLGAETLGGAESLRSAVIDTANGYAYFGTDTTPGSIIKVALGAPDDPPSVVNSTALEPGEDYLRCATIDEAAGYAYFGTTTSPGIVVKVALGAGDAEPSRIGAAILDAGEDYLASAVIDPSNGQALFGTRTSPGIVVKVALGTGANDPARIGAVKLNSGENQLRSAVIDTAGGYAYFGTFTSPGRVVKIALGTPAQAPVRVGALTLDSGEDRLLCGVVDAAAGYAYFGTDTFPGRVVKVALGSGADAPTRAGALMLNIGENFLNSAVIDPSDGHAFFGTITSPGRIIKVALGSGSDAPTRVEALTLNTGEDQLLTALIDPDNATAFFGTRTNPGRILKVGTKALFSEGLERVGAVRCSTDEDKFYAGVIDPTTNYGYFIATPTGLRQCRIVKIELGDGNDPPRRVGAITIGASGNSFRSAVIDPANGYAYFGLYSSSGRVYKVALGAGDTLPSIVGSVDFNSGEGRLTCGVIDTGKGYAYFGSGDQGTVGKVIKIALGSGSAAPTRIGAVTLAASEVGTMSATIDPANGFAYFGTATYTGDGQSRVVKVGLGTGNTAPTRVGAAVMSGEGRIRSGVIDSANGFGYFGTYDGYVVKVNLGAGAAAPVRFSSISLGSSEKPLVSAEIDTAKGYAYYGAGRMGVTGSCVKVALGDGGAPPTRVEAITFNSGEDEPWSSGIDTANGYLYFGTLGSPGRIVKVSLEEKIGSDTLERIGSVSTALNSESLLFSGVMDLANNHAYFGTYSTPGRVIKVDLGSGVEPPTRLGALKLNDGENLLIAGLLDTANRHAYFSTTTAPGKIVKVALGEGDDLPTRLGALTLETGEDYPVTGVIDPANGYAYYGTNTMPGQVVKVALGAGTDPPTRVGTLTLNANEDSFASSVIDAANGYAYFGTDTMDPLTGQVIKVALGDGDNLPTRVGSLVLPSGEERLVSAVIDPDNGHAFFGTLTDPAQVIKVALGTGTDAPTRVGVITLEAGENSTAGAAIDTANSHAYFGVRTSPGMIVKINLGDEDDPPTRAGALTLDTGEDGTMSALIDSANGYAYCGMGTLPGKVVKVALRQWGAIKATEANLPETGEVQEVCFRSHEAIGNVRLAIYQGVSKSLIWQSGAVSNTALDEFLRVPIANGTPSSLTLTPADYWLAWQIDTGSDVPSYVGGVEGDGFTFHQDFGVFPVSIDDGSDSFASTAETWSMYFSYLLPGAPKITTQPQSQTAEREDTVQFHVATTGDPPMSYVWKKDNISLSNTGIYTGVNTDTLTLTGVEFGDAGDYSCTITNYVSSSDSLPATLTVTEKTNAKNWSRYE